MVVDRCAAGARMHRVPGPRGSAAAWAAWSWMLWATTVRRTVPSSASRWSRLLAGRFEQAGGHPGVGFGRGLRDQGQRDEQAGAPGLRCLHGRADTALAYGLGGVSCSADPRQPNSRRGLAAEPAESESGGADLGQDWRRSPDA